MGLFFSQSAKRAAGFTGWCVSRARVEPAFGDVRYIHYKHIFRVHETGLQKTNELLFPVTHRTSNKAVIFDLVFINGFI